MDYIKEILEKFKEDPFVYYIYQADWSIYGLNSDTKEYIVIIDDRCKLSDYETNDGIFEIYYMHEWFKMVSDNNILCWIFSCIDKKYKVKEYVKLTIPLDVLKLRKNMLESLKYSNYSSYQNLDDCLDSMYMDIITLDLTNQIIKNHKIINLQNSSVHCKSLNNCDYDETLEKYNKIINNGLKELHESTDGLYTQDLINKSIKESF